MLMLKEELKDWYCELRPEEQIELWKRFAVFLNDYELKTCMDDVRRGKGDLFEIHYRNGLIEKYQIYFYQIMRLLEGVEDDECNN